jgi:transcriptional regulator with XRE-family HTH domain
VSALRTQREALGAFLRTQRKLANLSLRELAALTDLSNAYLSQIERGLHEPSVRVLRAVADALGVPLATLLAKAGAIDEQAPATADAIMSDPLLSDEQKEALLAVYRSYVEERARPKR